ncbi:hypothetical protein CSPX01_00634 [Colletotrichum filicis]|nr:hypothetical protein CSPX01_00634 [Colletotrichum filicis]
MEDVLSKYPPDEDLIQRMEKEIQARETSEPIPYLILDVKLALNARDWYGMQYVAVGFRREGEPKFCAWTYIIVARGTLSDFGRGNDVTLGITNQLGFALKNTVVPGGKEHARLLLQEVIDKASNRSLVLEARMNLGYYHMDRVDYQKARQEFELVLRLLDNSTSALYDTKLALAKISTGEKRFDEAAKSFKSLLRDSRSLVGEEKVFRLAVLAAYLEFLDAKGGQAGDSQVGWFKVLTSYFPFSHIMREADVKVDDCLGQQLDSAKAIRRVLELRDTYVTISCAKSRAEHLTAQSIRRYNAVMQELRRDLEVSRETKQTSEFSDILTAITEEFVEFV